MYKNEINLKYPLFLSLLFFFTSALCSASEIDDKRRIQFKKINELLKIIQVAKEAGYDDEEIQKLTLNDDHDIINMMNYIQDSLRNQQIKSNHLNKLLTKKHLTVQDIIAELIYLEPHDMQILRDKLMAEVDE